MLSWWSGDRTSIPNLQIDELFTVQKRNHTSFSCAIFAFDFEYLIETAFAYLKALYIWVKADQRKFAGLTFSYIQAFIQAFLLMSVYEQRLSFPMLQNAGGGLEVLQSHQRVHGRASVRIHGIKPLKNVALFTSGGQINSLK